VGAVPEDLDEYPEVEGEGPEAVVLQRGEDREDYYVGENRCEQNFLDFRESDFNFF
jgi:hypothetical protein